MTSVNVASLCFVRHELMSRALVCAVSVECALPTNPLLIALFARILANAPPPHELHRTCVVCAMHALSHICPKHWLLTHLAQASRSRNWNASRQIGILKQLILEGKPIQAHKPE